MLRGLLQGQATDLEVAFANKEGILLHLLTTDKEDPGIGDVDSEEDVQLGQDSDGFSDREGTASPLELAVVICLQFEQSQIEEVVVLLVPLGRAVLEFRDVEVGAQAGDG